MDSKEQPLRQEYENLQQQLHDPAIFSSKDYPKLAKRQAELEDILLLFDKKKGLESAKKFSEEHVNDIDKEMAELARHELEQVTPALREVSKKLEEALTPKDPNDEKDAIIEIR